MEKANRQIGLGFGMRSWPNLGRFLHTPAATVRLSETGCDAWSALCTEWLEIWLTELAVGRKFASTFLSGFFSFAISSLHSFTFALLMLSGIF